MGAKKVDSKKLALALQKHKGNQSACAKELGIHRTAVQQRIKNDPIVRSAWQKFVKTLEKVGGTNIKIAKTIVAALDAETTKSVGFGEDRELVKEPDHYARLKATDQCLKIKRLIGEEPEKNPEEKHLHLHLKDKTSDELFAFIMSHLAERERQQPKIQIEPSSGV